MEEEKRKLETLLDVLKGFTNHKTIMYANTKRKVEWIENQLSNENIKTLILDGGTDSSAQIVSKSKQLAESDSRKNAVILTSDLVSVHHQEVTVIVNYDVPCDTETYAKRCTRHAQKNLIVINLVTKSDTQMLKDIETMYNISFEVFPENLL